MNTTLKHSLYGMGAGLLTVSIAGGVLLHSAANAADIQTTPTAITDTAKFSPRGGMHEMGKPGMGGGKHLFEALGLTTAELDALKKDTTGKTLSQLLAEKNISKDSLKAKELAKITENFNANFDKKFDGIKDKKVSELLTPPTKGMQKGEKGMGMGMHKGQKPTDEDLAKKLGITVEAVAKAKADGTLKDLMDKKRMEMKAQSQK